MIGRGGRVLLVGAGGLGAPAALVLARSGVRRLTLIDDDVVELTNLHRQVLYDEGDVGRDKVERAAAKLREEGADVEVIQGRLLPESAVALVSRFDLVVEGADNFATKFLAADACRLAGVPLVQAGAVRWSGWALCTLPGAPGACLRCVFEDIPRERADTCAEAGVVGPVVGVLGALEGALAIRALFGDERVAGELWSYRALEGALRASRVRPRADCESCLGAIPDRLTPERYAPPEHI